MTDLFHRLTISHSAGDTLGERMVVGWRAWTSQQPAGRWQRLAFWHALWRCFGKQQYLVQVDDHYLMATSISVHASADHQIRVSLTQHKNIIRHCLGLTLWRRESPLHINLSGSIVNISQQQTAQALPLTLAHCPTALLDDQTAVQLPVRIKHSG